MGSWDDEQFAWELKQQYASLKTTKVGFLPKIIAYKTIAFVYSLQYRCVDDGLVGRWEIAKRKPIEPIDDTDSRNSFMYQLRYPPRGRDKWAATLDGLLLPGAVVDMEIMETFDSMKIYMGLLLAVLLSLVTALAYGFAMGNDFGTGFSIASWMLTAFGFFAAVIAAGEYFGLEKFTSFQVGAGMEAGRGPPEDWY